MLSLFVEVVLEKGAMRVHQERAPCVASNKIRRHVGWEIYSHHGGVFPSASSPFVTRVESVGIDFEILNKLGLDYLKDLFPCMCAPKCPYQMKIVGAW